MLRQSQAGAVLATSLIILVVMTLLVLGMLKTSVIELKIGGIVYTAEQNFSNAEVALVKFINDNNGRLTAGCLTTVGTGNCFCTNPDPTQCQAENVGGNHTRYDPGTNSLIIDGGALFGAQKTVITAQQLTACVEDAARSSGNQINGGLGAVYFDVYALSIGSLAGEARVHQGVKSFCQ